MTPYTTIYDKFFHRIEEDREFFNHFQLPDAQVMEVAQQRASAYMEEAVSRIMMECPQGSVFAQRTTTDPEGFVADLTPSEIYLVSSLMFEQYIERDIAYLKKLTVNYTSKELTIFSPDNWRNSYNELFKTVRNENEGLMNLYKNKDRLTGAYLSVDFSSANA